MALKVCFDVSVHTATIECLRCARGIGQYFEFDSMVCACTQPHNGTNTHARAQRTRFICLTSAHSIGLCSLSVQAAFVFGWIFNTTLRYSTTCAYTRTHSTIQ